MYAVASTDAIGDTLSDIKEVDDKFDEAQSAKKSVILMIWRYNRTKV